jgi:ribonuclease HI
MGEKRGLIYRFSLQAVILPVFNRVKGSVVPENEEVVVYTDGACDPNPGVGGWAAVLRYGGHYKEISGGEAVSTNNRMELTAAICALEALKRSSKVVLCTDSEYVQKGVTLWLPSWKRLNWRRKTGAIKNLDLWQRLDAVCQTHEVSWRWVRGHSGDPGNERCDELATAAIRKLRGASRSAENPC